MVCIFLVTAKRWGLGQMVLDGIWNVFCFLYDIYRKGGKYFLLISTINIEKAFYVSCSSLAPAPPDKGGRMRGIVWTFRAHCAVLNSKQCHFLVAPKFNLGLCTHEIEIFAIASSPAIHILFIDIILVGIKFYIIPWNSVILLKVFFSLLLLRNVPCKHSYPSWSFPNVACVLFLVVASAIYPAQVYC